MYNKAIEKKPNHLEALIRLATIQANRGQFDDAIANFNRALGYDPNHEEANFALGKLYHNKDMERAEMHYKKVIE